MTQQIIKTLGTLQERKALKTLKTLKSISVQAHTTSDFLSANDTDAYYYAKCASQATDKYLKVITVFAKALRLTEYEAEKFANKLS